MSLASLIGQPMAVDLCRQWLKKETTHPLLFYGPEGVGKRTLALETAKALNCIGPATLPDRKGRRADRTADACDTCLSCRKIMAGHHPDVRVIDLAWQAEERREPIEKQQNLRIETVITERHRLLQSSNEGHWKVSILDDAHRLTADAANVLLKILEEPPANTALILVTPYRDRLFATILSRCQPVRFRPLSDEEMKTCLQHLGSVDAVSRLELALGSPGRALHLSREEQIEAAREAELIWESLKRLKASRLLHESAGRPRAGKPSRADYEQAIWHLLVPATRAMRSGDASAREPVRLIERALGQLRQNVQPGLVYDNLLLQLGSKVRAGQP